MKKSLLISVLLIAMTLFVNGCKTKTKKPVEANQALQFTSREELSEYLNSNDFITYGQYLKATGGVDSVAENNPPTSTNVTTKNDYTKTNVQVDGVDEGDIVKVDGNAIYMLTTKGFVIVKVNNGQMSIASRVDLVNYVPLELYCYENKLVTIGRIYKTYQYTGVEYYAPGYDYGCYIRSQFVDIRIYDISNLENPTLDYQVSYQGYHDTTRLVDGKLIYIGNYSSYNDDVDFIPKYYDSTFENPEYRELPIEDIYYFEKCYSKIYMIIGSIDLNNPQEHEMHAFLGIMGTIYASNNNLYVAFLDYQYYSSKEFRELPNSEKQIYTNIVRISFDSLLCVAEGTVLGYLDDQYHMDEYNGYLRLATTSAKLITDEWGLQENVITTNNIIIVNMDLDEVGKITNIAENERIYAIRFNKEKGVLVTFEQVDPLFNLDLSDPTNPKISKGLKEDGVSYYLHYIEGTDYVIGLGQDTQTNGTSVSWNGVKVSLYDMSSGEAVNVSTITLGDRYSYSEALYNPNAILYDKDLNIFAFAVTIYSDGGKYYYEEQRQGLVVFGFDNGKLTERAFLTDKTAADLKDQDNYYINGYNTNIKRGVRIGEYVYTISNSFVTSYKLADFATVQKLEVNQFN